MSFFQRYGIEKAKSLLNSLGEAIVKFDPNGATEAAIAEIEAKFDKLNNAYSVSKQDYGREQKEYQSISDLYKQRLAAAESKQWCRISSAKNRKPMTRSEIWISSQDWLSNSQTS